MKQDLIYQEIIRELDNYALRYPLSFLVFFLKIDKEILTSKLKKLGIVYQVHRKKLILKYLKKSFYRYTVEEIADFTGASTTTLYSYLKELGYSLKQGGDHISKNWKTKRSLDIKLLNSEKEK